MRQIACLVLPLAALWGCSGSSSSTDGGLQGQTDSGIQVITGGFDVAKIPVASAGNFEYVTAARSADGRYGIAFYRDTSTVDRALDYVELAADLSVTRTVNIEPKVERTSQLTVVFDGQGNARVGYLGADPNNPDPLVTNAPDGGLYWYQNDFAIATITKSGSLSKEYAVHTSADAPGPNNVANAPAGGGVVGISPVLVWTGTELVGVYRDIHEGQFPVQDYGDSDFESIIGNTGSWQHQGALWGSDQGGIQGCPDCTRAGFGALASMARSADGGTIVAVMVGEDDAESTSTARNLYTLRFDEKTNSWGGGSAVKEFVPADNAAGNVGGDVHGGPKVAALPGTGFALAWTDYARNILHYTTSTDGLSWNVALEDVFGSGTGGWMPALAVDTGIPMEQGGPEPAIAYYYCSPQPAATSCSPTDQELRVAKRTPNGKWTHFEVDKSGGYYPTLFIDPATGHMTVIYRDVVEGGIRVATQKG